VGVICSSSQVGSNRQFEQRHVCQVSLLLMDRLTHQPESDKYSCVHLFTHSLLSKECWNLEIFEIKQYVSSGDTIMLESESEISILTPSFNLLVIFTA